MKRSPLEMAIDKACGYDPNAESKPLENITMTSEELLAAANNPVERCNIGWAIADLLRKRKNIAAARQFEKYALTQYTTSGLPKIEKT